MLSPYAPSTWAMTGQLEPDHLDLTPYELIEQPAAFEELRAAGDLYVRLAIVAGLCLLSWMLIGLIVAWQTGRL